MQVIIGYYHSIYLLLFIAKNTCRADFLQFKTQYTPTSYSYSVLLTYDRLLR